MSLGSFYVPNQNMYVCIFLAAYIYDMEQYQIDSGVYSKVYRYVCFFPFWRKPKS